MDNMYISQEMTRVHREELMRKAEKHQLAAQLRADGPNTGLYRLAMARVGRALSSAGDSLQERYAAYKEQPACRGECRPRTA